MIGLVLFLGAALTLFRDYRDVPWATAEPVEPAFAHFHFRDLDREWYTWFGWAIFAGALTAVAAFFGALMNVSFMLAVTASTNTLLFSLSITLILAWRVARWQGAWPIVAAGAWGSLASGCASDSQG